MSNSALLEGKESRPPLSICPTMGGALRGFWRLTWKSRLSLRQLPLLGITVFGLPFLAFLVIAQWRARFLVHGNPQDSDNLFYGWLTFYLLGALPLYCLAVFGDLIRDELQSNTLSFVVTRPLTRARLLLVKFITQWAWVEILVLLTGGAFLLVGAMGHVEGIPRLAALLVGIQCIAVLVFGALSTLLGLLHRRYLVMGVVYGLVVEVGIGQIPTNINSLSITRHLRTLLANHSQFQQLFGWSAAGTGSSLLILGIAVVLFLSLAAVLFSVKEYHHSEEMRK